MNDARIYLRNDTIAAPSTPEGKGAIAVIRISGAEAIQLGRRVFRPKNPTRAWIPRQLMYGTLIDPETLSSIDDVMCVCFRSPKSYTGEDMVEIHCHGSEAVMRKALHVLYRLEARPAEPGEFTFRAVRNGKMDLSQAEAVATLIESRSQLARSLSLRMLEGEFSADLHHLKDQLVAILVEMETQLEFPDEALEEQLGDELKQKMHHLQQQAESLQKRAFREKRFECGIVTVLAGRPNVGKSSLFNRLLGRDRAIVTPHPGTTRDSLEGTIEVKGRPVTLIDTAGLRETEEEIESIGIQRSQEILSTSHIVLFVCEADRGLTREGEELIDKLSQNVDPLRMIVVANKCDLCQGKIHPSFDALPWPVVSASATKDKGTEQLIEKLESIVSDLIPAETDSAYIISARQERLLAQLVERIGHASRFIQEGVPLELTAEDLRNALQHIAELDGSGIAPDIMSTIFSQFCIGK